MYVIAITGKPCAGVTSVAKMLSKKFDENTCVMISLESYFKTKNNNTNDNNTVKINSDDICDFSSLIKRLKLITKNVVIIEGIFAFHPSLSDLTDMRIFVEADSDKCFKRQDAIKNSSDQKSKYVNISLTNQDIETHKNSANFIIYNNSDDLIIDLSTLDDKIKSLQSLKSYSSLSKQTFFREEDDDLQAFAALELSNDNEAALNNRL